MKPSICYKRCIDKMAELLNDSHIMTAGDASKPRNIMQSGV